MDARWTAQLLPELSNFYCHPGKAGGSPVVTRSMEAFDARALRAALNRMETPPRRSRLSRCRRRLSASHPDRIRPVDRFHGIVLLPVVLLVWRWSADLLWALGYMAAVWAGKRDPLFVEVVRRHVRYPAHFGS